jgi:predicted glycogen debranching enzyme
MAEWGSGLSDSGAAEYLAEAQRVRDSFRAKFWNHDRQCLYDVLGPDGPVAKLRPNQIFAVSLPHNLLDNQQQQAVVSIVERELLTPLGLRTLERGDRNTGRYEGDSRWPRRRVSSGHGVALAAGPVHRRAHARLWGTD